MRPSPHRRRTGCGCRPSSSPPDASRLVLRHPVRGRVADRSLADPTDPHLGGRAIATAVVVVGFIWAWWLIGRRVRSYGYAERETDLLVVSGILIRRSIVPYGRMQMVDLTAGPIDRWLGIATVQLHTAAATTDAAIPALASRRGGGSAGSARRTRRGAIGRHVTGHFPEHSQPGQSEQYETHPLLKARPAARRCAAP